MKKGYLIAASVINGVNTMGKRCIWNYDHKKIEYLEERGKKLKFEKIFELSSGEKRKEWSE